MIRMDSVSCRFGRSTVVDSVSLEIPAGDSVALWGANGAGKTTLIRSVLGLVRYEGSIAVGGFDARRSGKQARMLIGYVPQELGFYDELRVGEAVGFFARLKGLAAPDRAGVLAAVGLEGHDRKRICELSGGMKQRLALAIALLGDPPILVLDEVTASLDACGREEFVALLSRLSGSGRTMLFASHRLDEVTALARRVIVLEKGRMKGEHTPAEFAGRLGYDTVLHLAIAPSVRATAVSALSAGGFPAHLNGVGILVPVPAGQKAGPFKVLAEARITIDDFELLGPSSKEAHP